MISLQYSLAAAQEKQSVEATPYRVDDEVCLYLMSTGMNAHFWLILSPFFCRHHDVTAMFMCYPGKAVG